MGFSLFVKDKTLRRRLINPNYNTIPKETRHFSPFFQTTVSSRDKPNQLIAVGKSQNTSKAFEDKKQLSNSSGFQEQSLPLEDGGMASHLVTHALGLSELRGDKRRLWVEAQTSFSSSCIYGWICTSITVYAIHKQMSAFIGK